MSYTFKDHGVWRPYKPDPMPEWAEPFVTSGSAPIFLKRESDGVDFYEYRNTKDRFAKNSLVATTLWYPTFEVEIIKGVFRDYTMIFPVNQRMIEIFGVDPKATSVHDLFTEQGFDPENLVTFERPQLPLLFVSAAQAKTALFNVRMPDGTTMLDKVEEIVAAFPYRPVSIFYQSANNWMKADPYVRAIATELGLLTLDENGNEVDSGLDALFEAANKL